MKMNNLRSELINALKNEQAHLSLESAIKNLKPENRNVKPAPNLHSVWQLLEHIRISQEDILKYMIDPGWKSPAWPDDYWPSDEKEISDEEWNRSVSQFNTDLNHLIKIISDKNTDLTSVISHTENHTYLREILLVIDHNSYHTAQIIPTRKQLNDW